MVIPHISVMRISAQIPSVWTTSIGGKNSVIVHVVVILDMTHRANVPGKRAGQT